MGKRRSPAREKGGRDLELHPGLVSSSLRRKGANECLAAARSTKNEEKEEGGGKKLKSKRGEPSRSGCRRGRDQRRRNYRFVG